MTNLHQTVLLEEAVRALITNRNGTYVDCTYGRGGHSSAIASELGADGRLLVVDRDLAAIQHARNTFGNDPVLAMMEFFNTRPSFLKTMFLKIALRV